MQISNASAPLPNTVVPFSVKVDPPASGVTKDALVSTFAPLSEVSELASGNNSLSQPVDVYTPESLAKNASANSGSINRVSIGADSVDNSASNSESSTVINGSTNGISDTEAQSGFTATSDDGQTSPPADDSRPDNEQLFPASNQSSSDENADAAPLSPDTEGPNNAGAATETGLSPEDLEVIQELAARDREVRTHEQQHQSVGGQYAGSASFSYQTGPDGVQYAIGGEVPIDVSSVPNNPQATIDKMRTVRNAALAPAEPSSQDRSVASTANRIMLQAQAELASNQAEERQIQADKVEQAREQRIEDREQQQERQESIDGDSSIGVRTYESLIELGQKLDNGLISDVNLDELV